MNSIATEILIPDLGGDETNHKYNEGSGTNPPDVLRNFEMIDDQDGGGNPDSDEDSTFIVGDSELGDVRDLYNLPASSGSGTINKITVYFRIRSNELVQLTMQASIKTNSTVTDSGSEENVTTADTWETFSFEWAQNPVGPANWTWDDMDALQIGVRSISLVSKKTIYCTLVYVEIDYTAAPAGVTRKIKISGTFVDKPIKEKKAGTFQDKVIKIKVGGTFQDA